MFLNPCHHWRKYFSVFFSVNFFQQLFLANFNRCLTTLDPMFCSFFTDTSDGSLFWHFSNQTLSPSPPPEKPPVRVAYISTCASARVKYFFVACVYYFQGCHCKNHGCEKGRTPKNNHWANSGLSVFFWVLWSDSFRTIPVLVNVVTWRLKREKRQRKLLPLTSALKK